MVSLLFWEEGNDERDLLVYFLEMEEGQSHENLNSDEIPHMNYWITVS